MKWIKSFLLIFIISLTIFSGSALVGNKNIVFAASKCSKNKFFELPTWYEYIPDSALTSDCSYNADLTGNNKNNILSQLIGPIALAIVDIILRVAGLVAVGFVIWGGIRYTTSQGDPAGTKAAKNTILNALIGLVIAILAVGFVNFIGRALQ